VGEASLRISKEIQTRSRRRWNLAGSDQKLPTNLSWHRRSSIGPPDLRKVEAKMAKTFCKMKLGRERGLKSGRTSFLHAYAYAYAYSTTNRNSDAEVSIDKHPT